MGFKDTKVSDWDANAREYAALPVAGPLSVPCKRMLEAMDTASPFRTASTVLDVGCGPGTAVTLLIEAYGKDMAEQARLVASDFSKEMVKVTKEKGEKMVAEGNDIANCWGRLETSVMNAENLSMLSSDSVSHVMGSLVYFILPDPQKGLLEAKRVLKEGGVFACTSWARMDWMQYLDEAAQKVRPGAPRGFDPSTLGPWTETEGVKGELEAAGFHDVQVEYIDVYLPMDDHRLVMGFIRSKNPAVKAVVGDFNDEELDKCCEEWVKIKEKDGGQGKGVAVMGIGRK